MKHSKNLSGGPLAGRDALVRTLPMAQKVGPRRKDRYVGMFYFIQLGSKEPDIGNAHDIEKIMLHTEEAIGDPTHPVWEKGPYHWGEPLFGYYRHDDEWVIARHVAMLTMAEIDFIVFDTTNNSMHKETAMTVMKVFSRFHEAGWQVPRVAFYTNTRSGERVQQIYEAVYQTGYCKDIWFECDGKPLIIGRPEECATEVLDFFTFRLSQWPTEPRKPVHAFPWMAFERPQLPFLNEAGENEIVAVTIAQHPQIKFGDSAFYGEVANRGRSFHGFANDFSEGAILHGYNIAEQWEHAISLDPKIIFVTGWNEWTAGVLLRPKCHERPVTFIDNCSPEFSRDIEPRKGGSFDNYYMQLIDYVRRFKGTGETPVVREGRTIDIAGDFSQWEKIEPVYYQYPLGSEPRMHVGFGSEILENDSGRNHFDSMKVTYDSQNLYFHAKCMDDITPYDFTSWMKLFLRIQTPQDDCRPHWEGYHYLVNQELLNGDHAFVAESKGGWRWEVTGQTTMKVLGKEIHLSIPRALLGLSGVNQFEIHFKWTDNLRELETMEDFYLYGDAAPYGRLNYVYKVNEDGSQPPSNSMDASGEIC